MRPLMRILAPVVLVAALAACSSGSGSSGGSSPTAAPTSASPAANAAAQAQVTQVWEEFFSKNTPIAQKETLLQNGTTTMKPAVEAFAANPMTSQVTANVSKVTVTSPDSATVTYDIVVNGAPVMSSVPGQAVQVNGKWLVSDASLCSLLQLAASSGGGSSASAASSTSSVPGCS